MPQARKPAKKCEHNRQRNHCRECGGAGICEHGRRRDACRECGGSSFCEHGRRRQVCKDCNGASVCTHGRQRASCRDCKRSSICEHGKERGRCLQCRGSGICQHDRIRSQCRDCGGSVFCPHNRRRQICRECGGSSICQHGRQRYGCWECQNFVCTIEGCAMAGHRFSRACRLRSHMRSYHGDNPKALTKRKELEVHQLLGQAGLQFEYQQHLPFRGCGLESETQRAFADFVLYSSWGAVILEVDENQRSERDPSCDVRREAISGRCVEMGKLPNQHAGSRRQSEGDLRCQLPRRCPDAPQP